MRMKDRIKEEFNSKICQHVQGRQTRFFHRPQILFLLLALLVLSSIAQCQDTTAGATTVFATTTLTQTINTASTLITTTTTGASTLTMTTTTTAANGTKTDSISSGTLAVATNTSPITIPQPFDTAQLSGNGSNFTSETCPVFMRNFLADPNFQACVPFSLLLYTSAAFITLTREVRSPSTMLILGVICH